MAQKLLTNYSFFISYFIQITFLSCGFWLLDVPHTIARAFAKCCHNAKQARKENKKKFVDTYAFDLGYHMSYSLTMFAIAMVFSSIVPYVPIFAMCFFSFKYYVDKYNLSFVYSPEFYGVGIIKRRVVPLTTFNIIVYQLINVGFFASKVEENGENFLYFGLCFVVIEILAMLAFHFTTKRNRYRSHKKERDEQEAT